MPQPQSSYSETHVNATAGMVATSLATKIESLVFTGAANGKFGHAVGQGTAAEECVAGVAAADKLRGILVQDKTLQPVQNDEYVAGDVASVLFEGDIWVPVESAVAIGQDVTVKASTGQLSSAAASASQFSISGARWMTAQSTANGLAKVRLSGQVPAAT